MVCVVYVPISVIICRVRVDGWEEKLYNVYGIHGMLIIKVGKFIVVLQYTEIRLFYLIYSVFL